MSLTCTSLLDDGLEVAPLLPPLSEAQSQAEWDRAQEQARKEAELRENQEQVRKDGSPQAPSRSKQVLSCILMQQDNTSNSHQFSLGQNSDSDGNQYGMVVQWIMHWSCQTFDVPD
jgi:hypothetical protein